MTEHRAPTVSEIVAAINRKLGELGGGWVEGEIQEVSPPQGSGHIYLTLADPGGQVRGCIWRSRAQSLEHQPAKGERVLAHFVKADYYGAKGTTSIHIDRLKLTGEGELLRRKAEVLAALRRDGLTDRRREVPVFARRIGLIAGQSAQAKEDVITAIRERFAAAEIVFAPALVEGVGAVGTIVEAIAALGRRSAVDVIVIARGGGSVSELAAFDDEDLCRAIAHSPVPIVSAIGHTPHRPNCDFVAAASAHVPARTAELVVPSAAELTRQIGALKERLDSVPERLAKSRGEILETMATLDPRPSLELQRERIMAAGSLVSERSAAFYAALRVGLTSLSESLRGRALRSSEREAIRALDRRLELCGRRVKPSLAGLRRAVGRRETSISAALSRALGSRRALVGERIQTVEAHDFRRRGLALVSDRHGRAIGSAAKLKVGERLTLLMHDGGASAQVEEVQLTQGEPE